MNCYKLKKLYLYNCICIDGFDKIPMHNPYCNITRSNTAAGGDSRHNIIFTYISVEQNVTFLTTLVRKNAMLRCPHLLYKLKYPENVIVHASDLGMRNLHRITSASKIAKQIQKINNHHTFQPYHIFFYQFLSGIGVSTRQL